jgi:hypothetical protein
MPWCLGRNETRDQRVLDNLKLGGYAEGVLHAFADEVPEKVRLLVPQLMVDRDNVVSSMCVNLIFRNATIFAGQCHKSQKSVDIKLFEPEQNDLLWETCSKLLRLLIKLRVIGRTRARIQNCLGLFSLGSG